MNRFQSPSDKLKERLEAYWADAKKANYEDYQPFTVPLSDAEDLIKAINYLHSDIQRQNESCEVLRKELEAERSKCLRFQALFGLLLMAGICFVIVTIANGGKLLFRLW